MHDKAFFKKLKISKRRYSNFGAFGDAQRFYYGYLNKNTPITILKRYICLAIYNIFSMRILKVYT